VKGGGARRGDQRLARGALAANACSPPEELAAWPDASISG